MTIGDKIKYYRNNRGYSQEQLAALSGMNLSSIKKYETNVRNPKPDQIRKIASALGVSSSLFLDIDMTTISDVMALLLCMHENIPMTIFADKNSDGEYIPETVSIKFNNKEINRRLCSYMNGLDIEARVSQSREQYKANPDDAAALEDLDAMLQMIKLNVVDCNQIVKKD